MHLAIGAASIVRSLEERDEIFRNITKNFITYAKVFRHGIRGLQKELSKEQLSILEKNLMDCYLAETTLVRIQDRVLSQLTQIQ